ncbi:hypothetical protein PMIN03_011866 [Paraphaeosphaeria minitans]
MRKKQVRQHKNLFLAAQSRRLASQTQTSVEMKLMSVSFVSHFPKNAITKSIENIPFHPAFRQGPLIADVFLIKARQALPETRSAKNATTKGIKKSHFHHDPLIAGLIPVKAQQAPEKSMSC